MPCLLRRRSSPPAPSAAGGDADGTGGGVTYILLQRGVTTPGAGERLHRHPLSHGHDDRDARLPCLQRGPRLAHARGRARAWGPSTVALSLECGEPRAGLVSTLPDHEPHDAVDRFLVGAHDPVCRAGTAG